MKDHPDENRIIELVDTVGGQSLVFAAHRDHITEYWLKEIKEFAKYYGKCTNTTTSNKQNRSF